jgi:pteridine reductase
MNLRGKTALVSGAGVRLGRTIASALAARECRLILHCRKSRREARELARAISMHGGEAVVLSADLARAPEAVALAHAAERAFDGVDVLINSAAIFWPTPPEKLNAREFDAFIHANLRAPYLLASELGRRMKARGSGAIVNLACVSAFRPLPTHLPYSISKAGVVALTIGLARLLGPEVRVNAIAPGAILPPAGAPPGYLEKLARRLPLQRTGSPQDIVQAVLYLLEADFVTGQVLAVDGGQMVV